ncbi:hypothetical protein H4R21_004761 [Coemansia helicoidea]|uniref:Uncharacterized protein n=1 Tax=Coemansia helicoidea TaxID=1286919 RepID=A0ACC1KX21_9FUNG|nr:hypothetical protein H4R21_004761 [Coemansia helicoidea]
MPEQATFVTLDNIVNGWRQRVLFFIDTSAWGKLWDVADLLLNIALCVVYIINTTVIDEKGSPARIPTASRLLEFVLAGTALSQYIVRYVAINANQRVFEHAVALVAFGAPMVAYIVGAHSAAVRASYMGAGVAAVFYPARFLRLHYAMQRAVALGASIPRLRLTLIRQEVISLCSDIVVVILAFACFVHSGINWYSQSHGLPHRKFTFLDAIYSIVSK